MIINVFLILLMCQDILKDDMPKIGMSSFNMKILSSLKRGGKRLEAIES